MLAVAAPIAARAAAHIPASDETVLEVVPAASQLREIQPLRRGLAANPTDPEAITALARGYLGIGRSTSDPRFVSYAQAVLAPLLQRADVTADALVLAAIALQSSHRFDEAQQMLDRALQKDPQHAQAWLTKATVLQVQGDFAAARKACARLITAAGQLVAVTCLANADSMMGRLSESYESLQQVFVDDERLPAEMRSWIWGELGEMSVRLGLDARAEQCFETALRLNPADLYVRGEYADLLLRLSRPGDAVRLLADNEAQDALLLRLAIAGKSLGTAQGRRWAQMFQDRSDAAARDSDGTHMREQARFLLDVRSDASAALSVATRNWQVQREPADIRIYARAAAATRNDAAKSGLLAWTRASGYQDATLAGEFATAGTAAR
ncbi:MAG: tetratricopeptide repeat protein [Pseudomonadota bacterium]